MVSLIIMVKRAEENLSRPARVALMEIRQQTGVSYKQIISAGILAMRDLPIEKWFTYFAAANDKDFSPTPEEICRLFVLLADDSKAVAIEMLQGMAVVDDAVKTKVRLRQKRRPQHRAKGGQSL